MRRACFSLALLFYLFTSVSFADQIDNVAELLRQGNIHELSKQFAPNVDVNILDDENNYPKNQAEQVLDRFFRQNKPESVKILHKINSNPAFKFGVVLVNTDKGVLRVAYTIKDINSAWMLVEVRIETEKVK